MASRLRTWARRVAPPSTRALARRVAVELLERVTYGAEQIADSLRPALPAATAVEHGITVRPAKARPAPPPSKPKTLAPADLGWALARHVSTQLDTQMAALFGPGLSADGHDAEHVRRMRIGSRRLRSAAQLFAPWLGKKLHRRLERDLKAFGGALGPLRDLDVVVGEFSAAAASKDPLRQAAAEHIRAGLARNVAKTRKRAAKGVRAIDHDALRKDLREAKRRIVERLTGLADVRPALAALLLEVCADAFEQTPVPTTLEDREAVHEVRIIAKRLRYAHAWVKPALQHGPGAGRLLKKAQRAVGASRDLDLLLERLESREAALREDGQGTLADALAQWQAQARSKRDKADSKILPALADLSHRTVTRLTRDALGVAPEPAATAAQAQSVQT